MLIKSTDIISQSLKLYQKNWKLFLKYVGLYLFTILAALPFYFIPTLQSAVGKSWWVYFTCAGLFVLLITVYGIFIGIAFTKAIANAYINLPHDPIGNTLKNSIKLLVPAIIVSILTGLIVFIVSLPAIIYTVCYSYTFITAALITKLTILGGFLLLIIPIIIFAVWYSFSFYALALDGKKGMSALKQSKELIRGRWWGVLWRLFAPGFVFGFLTMVLQYIAAIPLTAFKSAIIPGSNSVWYLKTLAIFFGFLPSVASMLVVPLTTAAVTILYLELKKTPVDEFPIAPTPQN